MIVNKWLTENEARLYDKECKLIVRDKNFECGDRWSNYTNQWQPEQIERLEALRDYIDKHNVKAISKDKTYMNPKFSDGFLLMFNFRMWANLLAAVWAEKEDFNYNYTAFVRW